MKKGKSLYKRLNELCLIVSCNLQEIGNSEYLDEVIEVIQDTRVSIYTTLFEDAREYFKRNKKMPDFEYIDMHFEELVAELEGEEPAWHSSFSYEFLDLLKRDRLLQQITLATAADDIEEIEGVLEKNESLLHGEDYDSLPTWEELGKAYDNIKNSKPPLSFGIRELDKLYRGLCYGTLNIMAAPPGKFKTTTMNSVAFVNLQQDKKVLYITLEDSWHTIYFNLTARESYEQDRLISASTMKIGQLDEDDETIFNEVIADCVKKYNGNLRVACQERWRDFTPAGMLRLLKQAKKEMGGLDLVILDHASLMKFYRVKGINDPKEIINFYMRWLTNQCIQFEDQFALLVAMQTNREGIKELEAGKTGSLTNLAEANEAERSASTVTLIYSGPNAVESNIINFYPKKNRRGALTSKPIISFIEPGAYFVGNRAVAGDIDLDDLMDDMDDKASGFEKSDVTVYAKSQKSPSNSEKAEKTKVKKPKKFVEEEEDDQPVEKSGLTKRKIKRINGKKASNV